MAFDIRVSGEHAKVVLSVMWTCNDSRPEIRNSGRDRCDKAEIEAANVTYIDLAVWLPVVGPPALRPE